MITVKIGDGLGNQIYNYVCGYAVAKHYGQPLCLDISDAENNPIRSYQLDVFNLDKHSTEYFPNNNFIQKAYKRLRRNLKYKVVFEKGYASFKDNEYILNLMNPNRLYLHGYWQSIRFFEMYEEDLRRQLVPAYDMSDGVKALIKELRSTPTCAVHMRGGDIAMPEADYFINAIKCMSEKCGNHNNTMIGHGDNYDTVITEKCDGLRYIIFTNDKDKALTRLNKLDIDYVFIDELYTKSLTDKTTMSMSGDNVITDNNKSVLTDIDEFFLMSACQNQIVSESTFSTWAAILNNNPKKLVIAPIAEKSHERCPADWIFL